MKFYKDHYDVVIIGGALAGLSAALQLQQKGINDILILEKHNLPGGLATSYVRNGIEIEATLHEMMSIGSKEDRLKVGTFFDECGIDYILENVCKLDPKGALATLVKEKIEMLKGLGYIK